MPRPARPVPTCARTAGVLLEAQPRVCAGAEPPDALDVRLRHPLLLFGLHLHPAAPAGAHDHGAAGRRRQPQRRGCCSAVPSKLLCMLIVRSVPSPLPILSFPHSLPLPLSAQLPPPRCPPPQVWLGAFPIVINYWAALSITVYYAATLLLMYYTRALSHLTSMWFSAVRGRAGGEVAVVLVVVVGGGWGMGGRKRTKCACICRPAAGLQLYPVVCLPQGHVSCHAGALDCGAHHLQGHRQGPAAHCGDAHQVGAWGHGWGAGRGRGGRAGIRRLVGRVVVTRGQVGC